MPLCLCGLISVFIPANPWLKRFCSTLCLPKKYFNYFGPWTADVHHPLLKLPVMNVITTALNDRPVKKRGAGVLACRLPHRPGACLFSPRAQLVAPKPPSDGGSPEAKACQFARRALFLCASVVKIREFHFAPLRLCVESGHPFLPRAPRLVPRASPATSGYIRLHPANKKNKKI